MVHTHACRRSDARQWSLLDVSRFHVLGMIGAGGHVRFMGRSFESVEKRSRLPALLKAARVISFLGDVPVLSEKMAVTEPSVSMKDDGVVPSHSGPGPGARNRHDGFRTIGDHATALTRWSTRRPSRKWPNRVGIFVVLDGWIARWRRLVWLALRHRRRGGVSSRRVRSFVRDTALIF
jgi:hypothetical protein